LRCIDFFGPELAYIWQTNPTHAATTAPAASSSGAPAADAPADAPAADAPADAPAAEAPAAEAPAAEAPGDGLSAVASEQAAASTDATSAA